MKVQLQDHINNVIAITDDEFAFIQSHFSTEDYKKNEFLFQSGESVNCYFVVSGLLKLIYNDSKGKEHIVSFAMEDWWESDFLAYFNKKKATLSLQCIEDTQVLVLSLENYHKLSAGLYKMQTFFLKKAHFGHIASQNRILSLLTATAKERYEYLLNLYPALLQRVPKTLLAVYLGVSREALSRISS